MEQNNQKDIRILTVQEVANILRVHRSTITPYAITGELKSYTIGNRRLFKDSDLRHTFASNLLLSGSNIKDVKEMIGYRDLRMTDRYSHLTLDHQGKNQKRLAEHYSNGALQS